MEKKAKNKNLEFALKVYTNAKTSDCEGEFEIAKEKYQLAAKFLIELVNETSKSDPNYDEYTELAKEILTKAEECKDKLKVQAKKAVGSSLLTKATVKPPRKTVVYKEEEKKPISGTKNIKKPLYNDSAKPKFKPATSSSLK